MNTLERSLVLPGARPAARHGATPPAARLLLHLLPRLSTGALHVTTPAGGVHRFGPGGVVAPGTPDLPAGLVFHDWRAAAATLKGGDVGFGESYAAGLWDTPDLVHLLTVLAANQPGLERAFYGHWWGRGLLRLRHWLKANTRAQAKKNIVAHYDLGNDFYRLWLDPTMTYSAALFAGDRSQPLAAAQQAKYHRILAELALPAGAHILEIGCGWGGFAEVAARAGYQVTGLSLSEAQTAHARERIARAGLAGRVTFRVQDYRDERDRYDGVASIEMFEAVGEKWWPTYFRTVRDALVPGGRACIQAITIADDRFERYRRQSDFIQQHMFPGGMLASPSRFAGEARAAGLVPTRAHTFGADYAETLVRWLAAFDAQVDAVRAQGFDERFVRCWRFYLAYCAAGFLTETIDVGQYTFAPA
jgi:cyclopropane-fatty-acyl-phospholipid synthase